MKSLKIAVVSALGFLLAASAGAFPIYSLTDLGTLGGISSYAYGINASGMVVGGSATSKSGIGHAFLYSEGSMQDLGTLGGTNSGAYAVNDSGEVAGASYLSPRGNHAFLFTGGAMQDLGTLGGSSSTAYGINDSGEVAGTSSRLNKDPHAFCYDNGAMTDLGSLGGPVDESFGSAINDSGQVTGTSFTPGGLEHAFLYSDGQMLDLGAAGGLDSYGYGINNHGDVVGYGTDSVNDGYHAFLYSNGIMRDIGVLGGTYSYAYGVNDSDEVVGSSDSPDGGAFLYSSGTMVALNSLLDGSGNGWDVFDARGINDNGWIAATAANPQTRGEHAVLLKPVPEPATLVGLAVGLYALLRRRST